MMKPALTFSTEASKKVLEFMKSQGTKDALLRIVIPSASAQEYNYQFFLDEASKVREEDIKLQTENFQTIMDPKTAEKMDGAFIDWMDGVSGAGFKVENPNKPQVNADASVEERIKTVFENEINPMLESHGGAVELLEVKGPRAFVRMSGGCQGCASSAATLKQGIEVRIKEVAPEILEVIDSTDHAAGTNPYYQG